MDRVRVGIVGAGNIVRLQAAGYLEHPRAEIVALCDRDGDKAAAVAAELGIPRVHADLDALLADETVDAVEILTPTHLHAEHALAAVAAGKHVSCQKPIANSVADGRAMALAAELAGVELRISECFVHYPPLLKAKELIDAGAIGEPTVIRIKTVCGRTDSPFERGLDPQGYVWRFTTDSPGGHLFDDVIHKYVVALWLVDAPVVSVQAVVRRGALFFEAPTAALWEYDRPDLLGLMEVSHAPGMYLRSRYYGADEFFEVQGTEGFVWVTRATGELLDLPPVVHYDARGATHTFPEVDADWAAGFRGAARHFVDALLAGTPPDMRPERAIEALQLCFAVYEASNERRPVDPRAIDGAVRPDGWPPSEDQLLADAHRLGYV